MKRLILLIIFIGLLWADGGFIPPPGNVEIYGADQIAVIKILPGVEELSILVKAQWVQNYEGFAWIIPLPNLPEIDEIDTELFTDLAYVSAPIRPSGGCTGPFTLGDNGGTYGGSVEPGREYYDIISYDTLGFLEVVLIQTNLADSLSNWLTNSGYVMTSGAEELFDDYLMRNWNYFFIARVDTQSNVYARNVGIKLTFNTSSLVYPMKISSISSSPGAELFLYTIGQHKMFFDDAQLEYANFVSEEEMDAIEVDFPALAAYIEEGSYITKLTASYNTPQDMNEDIVLHRSPDDTEYRKLAGGDGYYLQGLSNSLLLSFILLLVYIGFRRIKKRRSSISSN
jgi:hypothetical protein